MIQLELVTGADVLQQATTIAGRLRDQRPQVVLLQGLPLASENNPLPARPWLRVQYLAPACPCCIGQLAFMVTLNRAIRTNPEFLYLGIREATHLPALTAVLTQAPYDGLLTLAPLST